MIVGVDVTNSGNDHGAMAPMNGDLCQRYDTTPDKYLVDGGFHTKDDITTREQRGTQVFAPIHGEAQMIENGTDPHARQKTDTDERAAFRQRMATDDAKQLSALRQLCWRPKVSGTALAAGLGENNRRLAPYRSQNTIFNTNGGEPSFTNNARRSPSSPTPNAATAACTRSESAV